MNHEISNGVKTSYFALAGVLLWSVAPYSALAQSTPDYQPFVFEIKNSGNVRISLADLGDVIFSVNGSGEDEEHEPKTDPRLEPLKTYLESKNSPMAPFAEELLKHYHYRLIIGISFAESNFCKRNIRPHNCWGIGGGKPEVYKDYSEALERANTLINKYYEGGLTTPKLMRNRWVGWQNNGWIVAVNQVTKELENRGI